MASRPWDGTPPQVGACGFSQAAGPIGYLRGGTRKRRLLVDRLGPSCDYQRSAQSAMTVDLGWALGLNYSTEKSHVLAIS